MRQLENLKYLRDDMVAEGWIIASFIFSYKGTDYVVLVKLYCDGEDKPQYALVKLEFIDSTQIERRILIPANSSGFITTHVSVRSIREFFGVEYVPNLSDFFSVFYSRLNYVTPISVNPKNRSAIETQLLIGDLNKSDGEDPDKIYPVSVMRNPIVNGKQKRRSVFNATKTRILNEELYERFVDDDTISFCYSKNRSDKKSNEEILRNFAERGS